MKKNIAFLMIGIVIGALLFYLGTVLFNHDSNGLADHQGDPEQHQIIEAHDEQGHIEEVIPLTDEEMEEIGIVIRTVGSHTLQIHSDLTGQVVPEPDRVAHIVPRFAGVVKNVYKKIGDGVKRDEVIAVIESNESLVTYRVKSSIDGVVLELHMIPGELIGDDSHVVMVADLSSVWAELGIYQKDLNKISVGQTAEVYFDKIENAVNSTIFYISPTVNQHTRTATARVRLNNKQGYWKPGMFVTAQVLTEFLNVNLAVEINAIQNLEGQQVVFIRDGDGFRAQPVSIGRTNTVYAEIVSGMNAGQEYIAQGAFTIKAELLKESFGGGHDH
jgi:cobalt-zinc-cadmium efflux system membrane fusion protein